MESTAQISCLAGKVQKWTLPVFNGAPPAGAPTLKRMLLGQGELAQVHDDDRAIHYLAFIELRAGTFRGNHFHKVKEEFVYLLSGEVLLLVEEIESKANEALPIRTGDLIHIAPGVAHTLRVTASGQAIEFANTRFDPADIHRYLLTDSRAAG